MARPLTRIRAVDVDMPAELRTALVNAFGPTVNLDQLDRKMDAELVAGLGLPLRNELKRVLRVAKGIVNGERDARRARTAAQPKCASGCGNCAPEGGLHCRACQEVVDRRAEQVSVLQVMLDDIDEAQDLDDLKRVVRDIARKVFG